MLSDLDSETLAAVERQLVIVEKLDTAAEESQKDDPWLFLIHVPLKNKSRIIAATDLPEAVERAGQIVETAFWTGLGFTVRLATFEDCERIAGMGVKVPEGRHP